MASTAITSSAASAVAAAPNAAAAIAAIAPTGNRIFKTLKFDLDPVTQSPTTLQYKIFGSNHRTKQSTSPHFKPRFTFKSEDRVKTLGHPDIKKTAWEDPLMPAYPYGKNVTFQEANFGLYGGATVTSGNKISKGRNKGKTLRHWFPNVRLETIRSNALDRDLRIPVTARVMRTIRKCGGLDEYLCGEKPARIKELGLLGWRLRWLVMTSPKKLEEYGEQRRTLGLEGKSPLVESFEDAWNDPDRRQKMIEEQERAWQSLRDAAKRFEVHVQNQWIDNGDKHPYKIHELQTLKKETFTHFQLPATLPEYYEDEVTVPGLVLPSPDAKRLDDNFASEVYAEEQRFQKDHKERRRAFLEKKAASEKGTKVKV